jgi:hypothetical protein
MARLHNPLLRVLRALVALLLPLWLLCACAGSGPSYADEKVQDAEIDYRARHEMMLRVVLLRPAQMEAQRQEQERMLRELNRHEWDAVMARHDAFVERQIDTSRRDRAAFEAMLSRQQALSTSRDTQHSERWAQFLEQRAPGPGGGAGAAAAAPPAAP